MKEIRLSQWAADHGYSYRGALSRFHLGRIPNSYQDEATGSIFVREVDDVPKPTNRAVLYARVSTRSQKEHLEPQLDRMRVFAKDKGLDVIDEKMEIASGVNDKRRVLTSIMMDVDGWDVLIVEYPDRLSRFGRRWFENWAKSTGRRIEYVTVAEEDSYESISNDIVAILTSFAAVIHGKRGAKNKALKSAQKLTNQDMEVFEDGSEKYLR